jgi:hypothetical protein
VPDCVPGHYEGETMNKKTAVVMLHCLIIYLVGTLSVFGQAKDIDLKDQRITIKMEKQPLGLVFKYLMENYDIPIGFEESTLDKGLPDYIFHANLPGKPEHRMQNADDSIKFTTTAERVFKADLHPITINVENERLGKVFDQIIKQMENYKWEINDGVVNIFPIKGRDERFEKLLGINIQRFTFEKGKTIDDITTNIQSLHEFLRFMGKNKLIFTGVRTGVDFVLKAQYGRTIEVGMDFSNLTFRDLLNKITKIKRGGWILKWKGISKTTGKEEIDIDI